MTTITIDDETKEELLKIGARLQKKKKIDYNTTIKYLIMNFNKKKDIEKLKNAFKPIKNLNVDDIINELYEERRKDEPTF